MKRHHIAPWSNGTSQNANAYSKAWQLVPRNEVRGNEQKGVMAR